MGNNHFQTFHDNPYPRGLGDLGDPREECRGQAQLLLKEMLNSKHDIKDPLLGPCQLVLLGISHPYHPRLNLNKPLPNSPTHRACMGLLEAGNPTAHRPTSSIPTVHRDLGRPLRRLHRLRQNLTAVCSENSHHSLNRVPQGVHQVPPRGLHPGEVVCNSSSKW